MLAVAATGAAFVFGGDDEPDDTAAAMNDLLDEETRALIDTAEPSPDCGGGSESSRASDSLVALDVAHVVDGCFTVSTQWLEPDAVDDRKKELAEEKGFVAAAVTPQFAISESDDLRDEQWGLDELGVPEGSTRLPWPTGAGVTVAVVDTGIDSGHPDLKGRVIARNTFEGETELDPAPHGTHVAGIIAAQEDEGGIAGVAPGVTLLDAVTRLHEGEGSDEVYNEDGPSIAESIIWSVDQGADVINMSFGYRVSKLGLVDFVVVAAAVYYARSHDVSLVAAAGNCGCDEPSPVVPAALDGVLAVGAAENGPDLWGNSSRWSGVNLLAPGAEIVSTVPGGEYGTKSGSSMAAPHVAATAAIVRAQNRSLSSGQINKAIITSAKPFWDDDAAPFGAGAGLVDIQTTLDHVEETHPTNEPQYSATEVAQAFPQTEADLPRGHRDLRTCATDIDQCATDGSETTVGLLADREVSGTVSVNARVFESSKASAEMLADLRRHDENSAEGPISNAQFGQWLGYEYLVDYPRGGDTAPSSSDTLHVLRGNVLVTIIIDTPDIDDPRQRLDRLADWAETITVELP